MDFSRSITRYIFSRRFHRQVASMPKEEIEIKVPPPKRSKVASTGKKKISGVGVIPNRVKPVNSTAAVTPVTPSTTPTSIPGSTATTTVPLPHAQHNSLPHQVSEQFDDLSTQNFHSLLTTCLLFPVNNSFIRFVFSATCER